MISIKIKESDFTISIGTEAILKTIISHSQNRIKKNVFLINVLTLIRNCMIMESKDNPLSDSKIIDNVRKEMTMVAEYISHYDPSSAESKYLIFYIHKDLFPMIPAERLRGNESLVRLRKLSDMLIKSSPGMKPNELVKGGTNDNLSIFEIITVHQFPHVVLESLIKRRLDVKTGYRLFMVSNIPFDYFLFERFMELSVIDSMTGNIWDKNHLSKKVFGVDDLPFNRFTYGVFGDKVILKTSLRNQKKILEEIRSTKKLSLMTSFELETAITKILKAHGESIKFTVKIP